MCSPALQQPGLEVGSPASAQAGSRGRRAQGKGWGWLAEMRFGAPGLLPAGVWEEKHTRSLKVCCRPRRNPTIPHLGMCPPKKLKRGSNRHLDPRVTARHVTTVTPECARSREQTHKRGPSTQGNTNQPAQGRNSETRYSRDEPQGHGAG